MDIWDIYFFFCSGRGKGESEAPGGEGDWSFIESPRRGGVPGVAGVGGAGRVSAAKLEVYARGGGGLNIFFGAERPPSLA